MKLPPELTTRPQTIRTLRIADQKRLQPNLLLRDKLVDNLSKRHPGVVNNKLATHFATVGAGVTERLPGRLHLLGPERLIAQRVEDTRAGLSVLVVLAKEVGDALSPRAVDQSSRSRFDEEGLGEVGRARA